MSENTGHQSEAGAKKEPNWAILQCPQCGKGLVNIGSEVKRLHPVARFIEKHYTGIVLGWGIFTPAMIYLIARDQSPVQMKSVGYAWGALLFLPSIVMFFLIRAFSLYRVTDCPYCGHHETKKLGRSHSV